MSKDKKGIRSASKKLCNKTVKYISFESIEEIRRQFGNGNVKFISNEVECSAV